MACAESLRRVRLIFAGRPHADEQGRRVQALPILTKVHHDADSRPNLEVGYHSGDLLAGSKLISILKLTPPQGAAARPAADDRAAGTQAAITQATGQRQNSVAAQAPAQAKFAVVRAGRGSARVVDLAQMGQPPEGQAGRVDHRTQGDMPPQR